MKVAMQWIALVVVLAALVFLAEVLDRVSFLPNRGRHGWLCIECRKYTKDVYFISTGEKTIYVCPTCFEKNESK